jgi:hypothetical protein
VAVARSLEHAAWSRFLAAHRARRRPHRNADGRDHVLILANDPTLRRWIEHELFGEAVSCSIVEALGDVLTSSMPFSPPWLQYLIVDRAEMRPADVDLLAAIRSAGWPCVVIAIGDARNDDARDWLVFDEVLPRTFGNEVLRGAIRRIGRGRRAVHTHRT